MVVSYEQIPLNDLIPNIWLQRLDEVIAVSIKK